MTLVIQIALGIVLAVVILVYWRELLALSVVLFVLAVIAIGGWIFLRPALNNINSENFHVWASLVGFYGLIAWVWWYVKRVNERRRKESSAERTRGDEPSSNAPPET